METDDETLKFESALQDLRPLARLDRDALLFEAGRTAGRRSRDRLWAGAAAGLALIAIGEGAILAARTRPEPRVVERLVVIREPTAEPAPVETRSGDPKPAPALSWSLTESPRSRLQRQILRYGMDGLPPSPNGSAAGGPSQATIGNLLRSELDALVENPAGGSS